MAARLVRVGVQNVVERSFKHYLASESASVRSYIYYIVGSTHYVLVVLYYYYRVVELLQLAQHMYQSVGVAAVQSDTRLVEYVDRAYERASEIGGEIDALALAAAKRVGGTVERKVAQPYVEQKLQTVVYLREQSLCYLCLVLAELEVCEPFFQVHHGHLHQFGYAHAAYLHPCCLLLESGAMAQGADRLATIAALQHAVLYLVLVFLDHLEERVDAHPIAYVAVAVGRQSVPQHVLLRSCQVEVRFEYGKLVGCCPAAEFCLPCSQLFAVPALHASVVYAQRRIGHNQLLVDAYHLAESLALGTRSCRRVECEHAVGRLLKRDAVLLKRGGKVVADI